MQRMIVLSLSLGLLGVLLGACNDEGETTGPGAERYGWVEPEGADSQPAMEIAAEAAAPIARAPKAAPAKKKAAPKVNATRGGRSRGKKYAVIEVTNGGSVTGVVKLGGSGDPGLDPIPLQKEADQKQCKHTEHASERCVYDKETRGLMNCVVTLNVAKGKDWPANMKSKDRTTVLDQVECKYVPHVSVCRARTQLVVKNSDPTEHNIHGYYRDLSNTIFNFVTAAGADPIAHGDAKLKKTGLYLVHCDMHAWMNSMIHAVSNPYFAITDAKGKFEIKDVPPGTYTMKVWHESLFEKPSVKGGLIAGYEYGKPWTMTKKIEIKAGAATTVECTRPLEK